MSVCIDTLFERLPELDSGFIDAAFKNHYVDTTITCENLVELCENDHGLAKDLLEELFQALRAATRSEEQRKRFWDAVSANGQNSRYLLGLVHLGVCTASSTSLDDKIVGLNCFQIYLLLVRIPLPGVSLFHPSLLENFIGLLRLPTGGPEKHSRGAPSTASLDGIEYSVQNLEEYIGEIKKTLTHMEKFLEAESLRQHLDIQRAICRVMVTLIHSDKLAEKALKVLSALVNSRHGDTDKLACLCCQHLKKNLLMLDASSKERVPVGLLKISDISARFILDIRDQVDNDTYILITIQKLALGCVEKSDLRTKTAAIVVRLLISLEEDSVDNILDWFNTLIVSSLPRNRLFTLELFSQLCSLKRTPDSLKRHLSGVALSALLRVTDPLSSVKSKAFNFFATLTILRNGWKNSSPRTIFPDCSEEDTVKALLGILQECINNEKYNVRRSALNVLASVLVADISVEREPYINEIVLCCRDTSVFIRKLAIESLSQIYRKLPNYHRKYIQGIFPLTSDSETSVQDKALQNICETVFDSLATKSKAHLGWNILSNLGSYDVFMPDICEKLCKSNIKHKVNDKHVGYLKEALTTIHASTAWKILCYLCEHIQMTVPLEDAEVGNLDEDAQCCRLIIMATKLDNPESFCESLIAQISFDDGIGYQFLSESCSVLLKTNPVRMKAWCEQTFTVCLETIEKPDLPVNQLNLAMVKIGECILVRHRLANKRLIQILRKHLSNRSNKMSTRRIALRTIGQISTLSEEESKTLIPIIGDVMDHATDIPLRVLAIRVAADVTCRFASLTDMIYPVVFCLLKDPVPQVRRAAIITIMSLIKEDYIKLKNNQLYHLLQCITDKDTMVRDLAEIGLHQYVLKKNPRLFVQNFIDCVFHLNGFTGHSLYNQGHQTKRELETFSLSRSSSERHVIYRFMTRNLSDEHRQLLLFSALTNIIKPVADYESDLHLACPAIVADLFKVLCSEELRLRITSSKGDDDDVPNHAEEEAPPDEGPSTSRGRKKHEKFVFTAIKIKHIVETILPPLSVFQTRITEDSEIFYPLMAFFKMLNVDLKQEFSDILMKDVAKKLIDDLKHYEASLKERAAGTPVSASPDVQARLNRQSQHELIRRVLDSARKQQKRNILALNESRPSTSRAILEPQPGPSKPRRRSSRNVTMQDNLLDLSGFEPLDAAEVETQIQATGSRVEDQPGTSAESDLMVKESSFLQVVITRLEDEYIDRWGDQDKSPQRKSTGGDDSRRPSQS